MRVFPLLSRHFYLTCSRGLSLLSGYFFLTLPSRFFPTMIWIFLSFITTPIFLETLRIFFKTLMQDSLSDLSLSLSRSNFLNLVYISFCRNSFFNTFLIVLLFGSLGLRFFKAYRERSKSENITMSDSSISYRTFVFTYSRSSLVLSTSTHWISLLSTSIFQ